MQSINRFVGKFSQGFAGLLLFMATTLSLGNGNSIPRKQIEPCPAKGVEGTLESKGTTLYYLLNFRSYVEIWTVDSAGQHNIGMHVDYPEKANSFRAHISPTGKQIAILFFFAEGDPPQIKSNAVIILADIDKKTLSNYPIGLNGTYLTASISSYPSWLSEDLVWNWTNDNELTFAGLESEYTLNVSTKQQLTSKLADKPSSADSRLMVASISDYSFFWHSAQPDFPEDFISISVVNKKTNQVVRSNLIAKQENVSVDETGSYMVIERPDEIVGIIDLKNRKDKYLTRFGWSELSLHGAFFPSPNLNWLTFHTTSRLAADSRVYFLNYSVDNTRVISMCVSGDMDYAYDYPSWSPKGQYQFMMSGVNKNQDRVLFVFDTNTNHLSTAITAAQFATFRKNNVAVYVVGWGFN